MANGLAYNGSLVYFAKVRKPEWGLLFHPPPSQAADASNEALGGRLHSLQPAARWARKETHVNQIRRPAARFSIVSWRLHRFACFCWNDWEGLQVGEMARTSNAHLFALRDRGSRENRSGPSAARAERSISAVANFRSRAQQMRMNRLHCRGAPSLVCSHWFLWSRLCNWWEWPGRNQVSLL